MFDSQLKSSGCFKLFSWVQIFVITIFFALPSRISQAQTFSVLNLPKPGQIVGSSEKFEPLLIKGISLHKENPLVFDFILDPGRTKYSNDQIRTESQRLIKYFFAALTVPEKDLWVNLSPYEKDRMIPEGFGKTEMGRDLLAQDYILKQLSASLIYPEKDLGKDFWNRVYRKAKETYGTTDIPVNTFNKVWIVPDKAVIVESSTSAYVTHSRLKVMLEEDYVSMNANRASEVLGTSHLESKDVNKVSNVTSKIVREIVLPEIEKEINEGKNFAQLRQIYNSVLLATWFKINLKNNILNEVYSNQNKVLGVNVKDETDKEKIYQQYLAAFREGVFNYIKEDIDETTQEVIPRKYFSGGANLLDARRIAQEGAVQSGSEEGQRLLQEVKDEKSQPGQQAVIDVTAAGSRPERPEQLMSAELRERLVNNSQLPEIVKQNITSGVITTESHGSIIDKILTIGEQGLFSQWDVPGNNDGNKRAFLDQLIELDKNYSGGLVAYKGNVRTLLENSKKAVNPFEGFSPSVPSGDDLTLRGERFEEMSQNGLKVANKTSFVIVAGGVGDRLGYKGIKVGIPLDLVSMKVYLQNYIETILSLQEKSNRLNGESRTIPLTIMTSNDTHDMTVQLLRENNYFGMNGLTINPTKEQVEQGNINQIIILKQGAVPAVANNDAQFVVDQTNPYRLQEKPHGHGDIHMLISQSGLAELWNRQGIQLTVFFQDTNGQVFNAIVPALGNSIQRNFDLNFLTVPRGAGEAAGAIVRMKYGSIEQSQLEGIVENAQAIWNKLIFDGFLTTKGILTDKYKREGLSSEYPSQVAGLLNAARDTKSKTFNVEYNELGPFLVKTVGPQGDAVDPTTGKSPYPGNLNVFIVKNTTYLQKLQETGGIFGEFINPKYANEERTVFKSPTRAETMMQDYAKYLEGDSVGYTNFNRLDAFSPVKNSMTSALDVVKKGNASDAMPKGEFDRYQFNRRSLAEAGVEVNIEGNPRSVHGIPINDGAMVVLSPSFAVTPREVVQKVSGGNISNKSVVSISGENVKLENVGIDGTFIVTVASKASLTVKNASIVNAGWKFVDLTPEEMNPENASVPQFLKMRGYRVEQLEQMVIDIEEPGEYELRADNKLYRKENGQWQQYQQGMFNSYAVGDNTEQSVSKENEYLRELAATPDLESIQDILDSLSPVDREKFNALRAELSQNGELAQPKVETPGGIDFNPDNIKMEINKENGGIKVDFDPKVLQEIRAKGIDGIVPVILNIQQVKDILPILSQNENPVDKKTAQI